MHHQKFSPQVVVIDCWNLDANTEILWYISIEWWRKHDWKFRIVWSKLYIWYHWIEHTHTEKVFLRLEWCLEFGVVHVYTLILTVPLFRLQLSLWLYMPFSVFFLFSFLHSLSVCVHCFETVFIARRCEVREYFCLKCKQNNEL